MKQATITICYLSCGLPLQTKLLLSFYHTQPLPFHTFLPDISIAFRVTDLIVFVMEFHLKMGLLIYLQYFPC